MFSEDRVVKFNSNMKRDRIFDFNLQQLIILSCKLLFIFIRHVFCVPSS